MWPLPLAMKVRFANTSEYVDMDIDLSLFTEFSTFDAEVFGWYNKDEIYIAILKEDYLKAKNQEDEKK